jgi:hypothetical protein
MQEKMFDVHHRPLYTVVSHMRGERVPASLKAFMTPLARFLGSTTSAALYERQRALVRAGLLDAGSGWGPGSGVRATASSVALLLISVLTSDSLSEAETRAGDIAAAAPAGSDQCPLTGMRSFKDAFASILTAAPQADRVVEITVSRTAARAKISYRDGRSTKVSEFIGPGPDEPGLSVVATLAGSALKLIAARLMEIVSLPDDVWIDENGWQRTATGGIDFNEYR